MNRILAIIAGLSIAGAAFAAEPVKTDAKSEPAKVETTAPAKSDSKPVESKDTKKSTKSTKSQPKGRRSVNGSGPSVIAPTK